MRIARIALPAGLAAAMATAQPAPEPVAFFIAAWDPDADGSVTLDEIRARRGALFHAFDTSGDGFLDATEFAAIGDASVSRAPDAAPEDGLGPSPEARRRALRLADADRDRLVSRGEFINAGLLWLKRMDRTGDGVITAADFPAGE